MERVQIFSLIVSLGLLFGVVELVRRRRLRESYSALWIFTSLSIIFFVVFPQLLDRLGRLVGVSYTPFVFFLLAFLFLTLITLQFSMFLSNLSECNKALTQEVALLKQRLEEVEKQAEKA